VNVLFYDELLVGTGTGLYAHDLDLSTIDVREESQSSLAIYPNPADNVVYFSATSSVSVYNLAGQLIFSSTEPVNEISTQDWETGVYVMILGNNDHRKLMIVR